MKQRYHKWNNIHVPVSSWRAAADFVLKNSKVLNSSSFSSSRDFFRCGSSSLSANSESLSIRCFIARLRLEGCGIGDWSTGMKVMTGGLSGVLETGGGRGF